MRVARRLKVALYVLAALVMYMHVAEASGPATLGAVTRLGAVDGGTIPAPSVIGGLVYDTIASTVYVSDGGSWTALGSGAGSSSGGYIFATLSAAQSTNISQGDHLKFDTVIADGGTNVTLDTTTTYANGNNVASKGRFTLKANHTYYMKFIIPYTTYSGNGGSIYIAWTNADNGAWINPVGVAIPFDVAGDPYFNADQTVIVAPSVDTRYEARLIGSPSQLIAIGSAATPATDGGALNTFPSAVILVLD